MTRDGKICPNILITDIHSVIFSLKGSMCGLMCVSSCVYDSGNGGGVKIVMRG